MAEGIATGYRGARGAVRSLIGSAAAWGAVGRTGASILGATPEDVLSEMGGFGQFYLDMGDRIGGWRDWPLENVQAQFCSDRYEDATGDVDAAFTGQGRPAARIAATGVEYEVNGQRRYDYRIDVFLAAPSGSTGEARILLDGRPVGDEEGLDLGRNHRLVGPRALVLSEQVLRAREACIAFPEPIQEYFTMRMGGPDGDDRTLCAEVEYP